MADGLLLDLTGKTAVVTGSTQGIGLAIARRLAEAGTDVVINGRNEGRVAQKSRRWAASRCGALPRT